MQQHDGLSEAMLNGKERIPEDFNLHIILTNLQKNPQTKQNIIYVFIHLG